MQVSIGVFIISQLDGDEEYKDTISKELKKALDLYNTDQYAQKSLNLRQYEVQPVSRSKSRL